MSPLPKWGVGGREGGHVFGTDPVGVGVSVGVKLLVHL